MANDLNNTPSANRVHIAFFGRRNAGKSSLVNAVTGQNLAIVSDVRGTTTDPVSKAMELLPLGPVVIIDTPGIDDEGELGGLRVKRSYQVLNKTDVAILVVDACLGIQPEDKALLERIRLKEIPYLVVFNKADLIDNVPDRPASEETEPENPHSPLYVSALRGSGIHELKERIAALGRSNEKKVPLVEDLIRSSEIVVLVIPIDKAAPKGRLILPQQMMIRGILDADGIPVCVKQDRLGELLDRLCGGQETSGVVCRGGQETSGVVCQPGTGNEPGLIITDSQVFGEVAKIVPERIPLTSFSILMARYKGFLESAVRGVRKLDELKDGDVILISEGCTHHRQCGDIGTEKLPAWIRKRTGKDLVFETSSGTGFPEDLMKYAMVIHCGGCMLNDREMRFRMKCAADQGIPFTNYGTAIAYMKGILDRSIQVVWK